MERWRDAFRNGVAPHLTELGLLALHRALTEDDPRLVQGKTTIPSARRGVASLDDCEGACAICFAYWQGHQMRTTGELIYFFDQVCVDSDDEFDRPRMTWWFVRWFDRTPREQMRAALIPEVELALAGHRRRPAAKGRAVTRPGRKPKPVPC